MSASGGVPGPGGVCLLREGGGVLQGVYLVLGVSALGGVCSGGVYLVLGGVPGLGGVCSWGMYLVPGGVPGQVLPPLWTEFLTHAAENITLPETSFAGGNKNAFQ